MAELDDLKNENKELRSKVVELEFLSKLNRFLADKRADTIKELLESHNQFLKKAILTDEKLIIKQMLERIQIDNEKYDELQKYLMKSFPKILKITEKDEKQQTTNRDDLSKSYIDENGNMYAPKHIIDVAIVLISQLKKQIEEIMGTDTEENY